MKERENIIFIVPSLLGGGALKTVSNICGPLNRKYNVSVIGLFPTEKNYDYSCKTYVFEDAIPKNPIKKIIRLFKAIKYVKKIKKSLNPKYSVSMLRYADLVNVFSKTSKNEKTIISIRNLESVEYKDSIFKTLQVKYCLNKSDSIVSISNEVKDDLIINFKVPADKITTIINPCAINIKNEPINHSVFVSGKTLITVGSLKRQKGQWHLIRALSRVIKRHNDVSLIILGKGPYEAYLKQLTKDLGLEKNVHFLGFVMNPIDYVTKADVFIFPSIFEGLGNAMMEAVASSKCILSTDYSSGAREILAPRTDYRIKTIDKIDYAEYGVLVPVCDGHEYSAKEDLTLEEKLMADAICNLLDNRSLISKYENATRKRSKDFDVKTVAANWDKYFKSIK